MVQDFVDLRSQDEVAAAEAVVLGSVSNHVATISLNRPERGNALDPASARALATELSLAAADPDVRCILLVGTGADFCVGGDARALFAAADPGQFVQDLTAETHRAIMLLAELDLPVVAAVTGSAAGAGLALTLVSDFVIAAETAAFGTAHLAVGLTPDCGTSWLLPQVVGLRRALSMSLTNDPLTGVEAASCGLVTELRPADQVVEAATRLAARLAAGPSPATGDTRWLLRGGLSAALRAHLEIEADTISAAAESADSRALVAELRRRRNLRHPRGLRVAPDARTEVGGIA